MKNHTQLLNYLIERYNLKSYCEIGVQNPANNFNKIKANYKVGVDPDVKNNDQVYEGTSDEYFTGYSDRRYDLVFIDGYHEAQQVKRDFENSLKCLNEGGFIVIHDTCPLTEKGTEVPRIEKRWWGDVYKFAMTLHGMYKAINYVTLDIDEGITIVWKGSQYKKKRIEQEIDWAFYVANKEYYLNIIPPADLEKHLPIPQ